MDKEKKDINKWEPVICCFVVMLISLLAILYTSRIWEMDFDVPVGIGGDTTLGYMLVKSVKDYGIKGFWLNYSLGAPSYSALVDTPFLDLPFLMDTFVLTRFISNPMRVFYYLYMISYPVAGVFCYLFVMKKLVRSRILGVILSVAFAIAPYHFYRSMGHLTLSRYFTVPIGIFLAISILEDEYEKCFPQRYDIRKRVGMVFLCLLLGASNVYYAFGGLMCIVVAAIIKGIKTRKISILWNEMVSAYTLLVGVFIGLIPKIIFTKVKGVNELAIVRNPQSSEVFALKIIQMLLPSSFNRNSFLRGLTEQYSSNAFNVNENYAASLGLLASIGFIIACCLTFMKFANREAKCLEDKQSTLDLLVILIITFVLYSVGGGVGTIVAYFITPEIRCTNRFSIVILCLALGVLGVVLDNALAYHKNNVVRIVYNFILVIVFIFVLRTEVPKSDAGWQAGLQAANSVFVDFFGKVQNSLNEGDMVYELPYQDFPEAGPIVGVVDYEMGLPYIYTDKLKWSYGGMKGRNVQASKLNIDDGMSYDFIDGIKQKGFKAVYINTKGYEDNGEAIIDFYSSQLGLTPIVSSDGLLYVYKLNQ